MKNRAKGIVLCVLAALLAAGAGGGCSKQEKTQPEVVIERIQIGITFDTFVLERWIRDRDVFVSTAKGLGAEVDVQNSNGDKEKQIRQVEEFIQQKKDVIVIVATDCYSLVDVVTKARNAGIHVISYDRLIQGTKTDLYITVDNRAVGNQMAEVVKSKLPDGGNVVMICGPEADTNSGDVAAGFEEALEGTNLQVVSKVHVKAWTPEYGFEAVTEAFQTGEKIDAVMCGNDGLAGYAIQALSEQQLAGTIVVTGQDADLEACQRVVEGTQTVTVYKPIEELARKAAEYAVSLAEGEGIKGVNDEMENDVGAVPYCGLEPIAVTAENIDEIIIDSGFHLKDEVYLNVAQ